MTTRASKADPAPVARRQRRDRFDVQVMEGASALARPGLALVTPAEGRAAGFRPGTEGVAVDTARIHPTADVDESPPLGPRTTVCHLATAPQSAHLGTTSST